LRGAISLIGSVLIALVAIILIGFVIPESILHWIYPRDTGDGPPGTGIWLLITMAAAPLISVVPVIGLTELFWRKLSPPAEDLGRGL
jgi:hypothetical protein